MAKAKATKREYIDVAYHLLCEKDFEEVTIREVARELGRNSASLYYYFEDLRELISVASVRYLFDYYEAEASIANQHNKTLEINLQSWITFAWYAFHNVPIYDNFFLHDIRKSEKALMDYLDAFPEERDVINNYFLGETFYSLDLRMRDRWMLEKAAEENTISMEGVEYLCDMDYYLFCGIMNEIRYTYKDEQVIRTAIRKFNDLLVETYRKHLLPGVKIKDNHLQDIINS